MTHQYVGRRPKKIGKIVRSDWLKRSDCGQISQSKAVHIFESFC